MTLTTERAAPPGMAAAQRLANTPRDLSLLTWLDFHATDLRQVINWAGLDRTAAWLEVSPRTLQKWTEKQHIRPHRVLSFPGTLPPAVWHRWHRAAAEAQVQAPPAAPEPDAPDTPGPANDQESTATEATPVEPPAALCRPGAGAACDSDVDARVQHLAAAVEDLHGRVQSLETAETAAKDEAGYWRGRANAYRELLGWVLEELATRPRR